MECFKNQPQYATIIEKSRLYLPPAQTSGMAFQPGPVRPPMDQSLKSAESSKGHFPRCGASTSTVEKMSLFLGNQGGTGSNWISHRATSPPRPVRDAENELVNYFSTPEFEEGPFFDKAKIWQSSPYCNAAGVYSRPTDPTETLSTRLQW